MLTVAFDSENIAPSIQPKPEIAIAIALDSNDLSFEHFTRHP